MRPGSLLSIYQQSDLVVNRAKQVLLDELTWTDERDSPMEDALLISWIFSEEKVLRGKEHARNRVRDRKLAFKERYGDDGWQTAKAELARIRDEDVQARQPAAISLIDGVGCFAWFSGPHYQWLSRMTGFSAPYILRLFQQDEYLVARAALAADDPPPEAFYEGFEFANDQTSPTLFDSAAPNQVLKDYINAGPLSPRKKAIARKVKQQRFVTGFSPTSPRRPRIGIPKKVNFEAGAGSRPDFEQLLADEFELPPPRKAGDKNRLSFQKFMAGEYPPSPPRAAPQGILRRRMAGSRTAPRRVSPTATRVVNSWKYTPSSLSPSARKYRQKRDARR